MKHELFTVKIQFVVGEGMRPKVLEELGQLKYYVLGNSLKGQRSAIDHASHLRWDITHEEYTHD